jgi:hypothetical protein
MPPMHLSTTSYALTSRAAGRAGAPGSTTVNRSMPTGIIAGIIFGCLFAFGLLACCGVMELRKRKKDDERKARQEQRWWREDGMR